MKSPYISVIIPVYNEEKDIEDCLKSLRGQSFRDSEVILVDDGSTDNTKGIVKRFKNVRLFNGTHKGPGFSRNIGAKLARGKVLVFVDADMTFHKDYLKNLIKPLLEDKNDRVIGTTHNYEIATNMQNVWARCWGEIRIEPPTAKEIKIFRAIRKDKFIELGGFDPKYGYADDQTFWYKYGIKPVLAKNTVCYHKNPETLKATYKQARWIGASWKERFSVFKIPVIGHISALSIFILTPIAALLKSSRTNIENATFTQKFKFFIYKFIGYSSGIFRAVWLRRFEK
jgi:glycosyltransferase involved in cell wall biosynthesis